MDLKNNFLVSDLFTPLRGKGRYTRHYAERNIGPYPVYSASLSSPLCYIKTYDYDGTYLTWNTNGYGGRMQIISGKFSINGDRGILVPKNELAIELGYIKHFLEPALIDQAVGRIVDGQKNEYTKVSPEIVAASMISLPVDGNGHPYLLKIHKAAAKIQRIESLQDTLKTYQNEILTSEVSIESEKTVVLSLSDEAYFSLSIGKRVLRKDSRDHGVPVYSANVNIPFAYIDTSNLYGFDRDSLIWGIDGIFGWNRIPAGVEFATTDHCGRLQVISEELDPGYIFYSLRTTRIEYGFDRVFRANLENMRRLVTVKIPIDKDGRFSLTKQKAIAKRYQKLDDLKTKACRLLDSLCKVRVHYSFDVESVQKF